MSGEQALDELLRDAQAADHLTLELLSHGARRELCKHGSQLLENSIATLGGLAVARGEDPFDAEADERQRRCNQCAHGLGSVTLEHLRRIAPRWKRRDAQFETLLGCNPCSLQHRLLPGSVSIERQHHRRCQARQLRNLLVGQRRAHQADALAHPRLVSCDHVGVALAQHHRPGFGGVRPGEVRAEQMAPLVVDLTVRAVEVLRAVLRTQRAGPEAEHASALVAQREGDAPPKAVIDAARSVLRALHESRRQQLGLAEAAAARGQQHAIPGARREADAKLAQDGLLEAPTRQVLTCPCALLVLPEHPLVVAAGAVEQLVQARLASARLGGTRVLLLALERHAVAVGEELDRADELEPLGLHREVEGIARRLTTEAVVDLPRRLDAERGRALLVKRAAPDVGVAAGPPQLGARAHEVHHVHGVADSLLGIGGVARHQLANARGTASSS